MISFISLARAAAFPLYSLFSRRIGFCIFYPTRSGWWAWTRGKHFPVREPRVAVLEYFRHFVPPVGGTVFDAGGELGFETRQFAGMVGPGGRVFVFECFPRHLEKLRAIAAENPQVTVIASACWNCQTELQFFTGHTPGSNTAVPEARGQVGQELANRKEGFIRVPAERLDVLWSRHAASRPVDFLKMDIEGAEIEALEGAPQLLQATLRVVVAAYHIRDGKPTAAAVAKLLQAAGFSVAIDENLHVYGQR